MDSNAAEAWQKQEMERMKAQARYMAALPPELPMITKIVQAGDLAGAEHWGEELRAGRVPFERAVHLTGSYARLDSAVRWVEEGLGTREQLLAMLPDIWPASDPDDTDPRFLVLWKEARAAAGDYLRDGRDIPRKPHAKPGSRLAVFRGQPHDAEPGIAWSLDRRTAVKFAQGAWARTTVANGSVLEGRVPREAVLGYLTGRGEEEIIVDPADVQAIHLHRITELRTWSFDAVDAEEAKWAMEDEMRRLGHIVLAHKRLVELWPGRWQVSSIISLGTARHA